MEEIIRTVGEINKELNTLNDAKEEEIEKIKAKTMYYTKGLRLQEQWIEQLKKLIIYGIKE